MLRGLFAALAFSIVASSPSLHPPLKTFQFNPARVGTPQPFGIAGQYTATHPVGQLHLNLEGLRYEQYYYGVKPAGLTAHSHQALYDVNLFQTAAQARNANSIFKNLLTSTMSSTGLRFTAITLIHPLNASQWMAVRYRRAYCNVVGTATYRNLQFSVFLETNEGAGPGNVRCAAEQRWVRLVEQSLLTAVAHYAAQH